MEKEKEGPYYWSRHSAKVIRNFLLAPIIPHYVCLLVFGMHKLHQYRPVYITNTLTMPVSLFGILIAINTILLFCTLVPQSLYMLSELMCYCKGEKVIVSLKPRFYILEDSQYVRDNVTIMKKNDWYFKKMHLWTTREVNVLFILFMVINCVVIGIDYLQAIIAVCVCIWYPVLSLFPFAIILTSLILSNSWGYAAMSVVLVMWMFVIKALNRTKSDIFLQELFIHSCKTVFVIVFSWLYLII
jgi:hypothetical protein